MSQGFKRGSKRRTNSPTTLYSRCDQASDLSQQLELASELESDLWRQCGLGAGSGLLISMLEKLN